MKPSNLAPAPPELLEALRARAGGGTTVAFSDFMEVALYDTRVGYYRRGGPRIGYGPGTDFFTASSSALFGRLVAEACARLVAPAAAADFDFVEIGAEPGGGVLAGVPHPFRSARQVRLGEPLEIAGRAVVFSNELLDSQPFRRFRFREGAWRELGVSFAAGLLAEVEIEASRAAPPQLPGEADEGYLIDAPFRAAALAGAIADRPWSGLFVAFDYGKPWEEIAYGCPEGTARAYSRHAQSNDLLARPGEQDLTCHVCWDWISEALSGRGFASPSVESQEAFFVRHASAAIESLLATVETGPGRDRRSLTQLLHPAHMGRKFQALWAMREGAPPSNIG